MAIQSPRSNRAGLSRQAIVARALALGDAEGLDAVTLRRLASDFGVTPMALYRHVRDKQDLVNAMTEVVLDDLDLTTGIDPSMAWTDKIRRALQNYKEQIEARPLAMTLSIEYTGDGPVSFWRMLDDLLGILVEAGFEQRQAVVLIRTLSNLLAGYLVLVRSDANRPGVPTDPREIELLRKRFELAQLTLPTEGFPNLVAAAADVADVWLSDPNRWWGDTVDLLVFGLERLLERSRAVPGGRPT
ncbi:MAG TPA: TetR/AcrR family transcriptional regulator [Candidatus Limnocylindrales bacterium]|nr:TetR/AcrR family transcriptional regulator [Candidatus Limnocylindrales bacterium]